MNVDTWIGRRIALPLAAGLLLLGAIACGSQSRTGSSCRTDDDCFADRDVAGDPICFDQVSDGYCSMTCQTDEDCCATSGVCRPGLEYVCTGLEHRTGTYCFIACSEAEGSGGDQAICDSVSTDFECRNTGRGVGSMACLPPAG